MDLNCGCEGPRTHLHLTEKENLIPALKLMSAVILETQLNWLIENVPKFQIFLLGPVLMQWGMNMVLELIPCSYIHTIVSAC